MVQRYEKLIKRCHTINENSQKNLQFLKAEMYLLEKSNIYQLFVNGANYPPKEIHGAVMLIR